MMSSDYDFLEQRRSEYNSDYDMNNIPQRRSEFEFGRIPQRKSKKKESSSSSGQNDSAEAEASSLGPFLIGLVVLIVLGMIGLCVAKCHENSDNNISPRHYTVTNMAEDADSYSPESRYEKAISEEEDEYVNTRPQKRRVKTSGSFRPARSRSPPMKRSEARDVSRTVTCVSCLAFLATACFDAYSKYQNPDGWSKVTKTIVTNGRTVTIERHTSFPIWHDEHMSAASGKPVFGVDVDKQNSKMYQLRWADVGLCTWVLLVVLALACFVSCFWRCCVGDQIMSCLGGGGVSADFGEEDEFEDP